MGLIDLILRRKCADCQHPIRGPKHLTGDKGTAGKNRWLCSACKDKRDRDPVKKGNKLYQKGLELVRQSLYREAIPILEEAATLDPASAAIQQVLGFSYSQVVSEYEGDEAAMAYWATKGADTIWNAIILHRERGGLEKKQVTASMAMVAAFDRITMTKSNTPPEEQRREIFKKYKAVKNSAFDPLALIGDVFRAQGVAETIRTSEGHFAAAEEEAFSRVMKIFGITERQLRAIMQEGQNKGW